jgi:uncharacterized protein
LIFFFRQIPSNLNKYLINRRKIINDPVHGFIGISSGLLFDLISHPFFQRLRRIKQLGITHLVYPGATHSRLQHSLGAMHLMETAIGVIRSKDHDVTAEEEEAALAAILLHDIGHGPFSHTLESSIIPRFSHELMSGFLMEELNRQFSGRLSLAIHIFSGRYHKKFLNQLVTGQLDMDRLDYLKRDSFYTGVTEGVIGSDRIIKMLDVLDDQLVVEAKGIYSIEKFLIARRLMYWQVYFHKTVVAAEKMLTMILKRAIELSRRGDILSAPPSLRFFLENDFSHLSESLMPATPFGATVLNHFTRLDDDDITTSVKQWAEHQDKTLSMLSEWFTGRILYHIEMSDTVYPARRLAQLQNEVENTFGIPADETGYFVFTGTISNYAYRAEDEKIRILFKNGSLADVSEASDMLDLSVLSKTVKKYFLCFPRGIGTG